jgi:PKD repeat protein
MSVPSLRTSLPSRRRSRGQSLVEFAILLPFMLLFLMVALDFGRAFFGWVSLNNTARVAANYAAINPRAWATGNSAQLAQYEKLISDDFTALNCDLEDPIPAPTFPSGTSLGGTASVHLTCDFSLITPVIGNMFHDLAGPIRMGASAVFPIRMGVVTGTSGGGGPTPIAGFNVAPSYSGTAPLVVTFTDTSAPTPTTWEWDFGDGTTFSGQTPPAHTYTAVGSYAVTLTVSNGLTSTTAVRSLTVTPPVGPVAAFTYTMNPVSGEAPNRITFVDASSGSPTSWQWTFGNGATSSVQTPPAQLYSSAGTYTVELTVTDALSQTSTTSQQVVVIPAIAMCTVPDFKNDTTSNATQTKWATAGFVTQLIFNPLRPPEFKITKQSLAAGSSKPCSGTVITVYDK